MLVFTDPHFTDREQDAYRWKLFPLLHEVEQRFGGIDTLACLGDLTEHKDCHSSALLHRIQQELLNAPGKLKIILKGNHDYVEEGEPFFDWLGKLSTNNVLYCKEPTFFGSGILALPHTRNPAAAWEKWWGRDGSIRLVLTHVTVDGCQSEMGTILPGISRTAIPGSKALVLSGDIHKPQHLGPDFIYVGTPYSTRFSPPYTPRVLLLEFDDRDEPFNPKITDIPTGLKRKITYVTERGEVLDFSSFGASGIVLGPEDELRVSVKITSDVTPAIWKEWRDEVLALWSDPRISLVPLMEKSRRIEEAQEHGVGVHTHPEEALSEYCAASDIPDRLKEVGQSLLRDRLSKT